MIKNFLTQWEIEEKNRKISSNILLIDRKLDANMLLIDRKLAELEDDVKCASLSKFIELVKKSFNLIKTEKEKLYHPISYSLTCFIEPTERPCVCFAKGLAGLIDSLVMGEAEWRREEVTISFSKWFLWNMEVIFQKCMTEEDGF